MCERHRAEKCDDDFVSSSVQKKKRKTREEGAKKADRPNIDYEHQMYIRARGTYAHVNACRHTKRRKRKKDDDGEERIDLGNDSHASTN